MKKTYINPEMEIVKLQTMQILAASIIVDITDESFTDPSEFDSHELDLGTDDFDFQEEEFDFE